MGMTLLRYHPDPDIDAGIHEEAQESERRDLDAGYPPRRWRCGCGAEHGRGHYLTIDTHRCLACGYVGTGGALIGPGEDPRVVGVCATCEHEVKIVLDGDGSATCAQGCTTIPGAFMRPAIGPFTMPPWWTR